MSTRYVQVLILEIDPAVEVLSANIILACMINFLYSTSMQCILVLMYGIHSTLYVVIVLHSIIFNIPYTVPVQIRVQVLEIDPAVEVQLINIIVLYC